MLVNVVVVKTVLTKYISVPCDYPCPLLSPLSVRPSVCLLGGGGGSMTVTLTVVPERLQNSRAGSP